MKAILSINGFTKMYDVPDDYRIMRIRFNNGDYNTDWEFVKVGEIDIMGERIALFRYGKQEDLGKSGYYEWGMSI